MMGFRVGQLVWTLPKADTALAIGLLLDVTQSSCDTSLRCEFWMTRAMEGVGFVHLSRGATEERPGEDDSGQLLVLRYTPIVVSLRSFPPQVPQPRNPTSLPPTFCFSALRPGGALRWHRSLSGSRMEPRKNHAGS